MAPAALDILKQMTNSPWPIRVLEGVNRPRFMVPGNNFSVLTCMNASALMSFYLIHTLLSSALQLSEICTKIDIMEAL